MYSLNQRKIQYKKLAIGAEGRYKHLTKEEIVMIYGDNSKGKLSHFYNFINRYDDLKLLEDELNFKYNTDKKVYLHWYIIKLIELERIEVNLECLMRLRITTDDYRSNSNQYIDSREIIDLEDFAIEKLKYSEGTIKQSVTTSLIRVMLYYKIEIEDVLDKSNEYTDELKELINKNIISERNLSSFTTLCKILRHKFVELDESKIDSSPIGSFSLKNKHEELRNGIDNFEKYMKIYYSNKYIKTSISHIRQFFNFLNDNFPLVNSFDKISNDHMVAFIENQKIVTNEKGNNNSNETINHRIEAVDRMLCYFLDNETYDIQENVVTVYEKLSESIKYTKYFSEKEILKIYDIIFDYECSSEELQLKYALIILADTARRQSEVLNLSYDCLRENKIHFHRKHHNDKWIKVGENSIYAVKKLQEMLKGIELPLFSELDNKVSRRLFTSFSKNCNAIISAEILGNYFKKIQIENNIVNKDGVAKYTLHDIKRSAVTSMLNSGFSIEAIGEYLNQKFNSFLPYEVNNKIAIQTLKTVEEKGLLMGEGYINDSNINQSKVLIKLNDIDLIERNKNNLIYKINNPKEVLPLFFGYCTDNSHFNVCSDLICLSCEEFYTDSIGKYKEYALKIYKYIYSYKRDASVKEIEKKVSVSLEYAFLNNVELSKFGHFNTIINKIKKEARIEVNDEKRK